jgi:hypothetical protein
MAITANPDSLAADGAALADRQTVESPHGCEPAGADSVSVAVAAQLSAHSASLTVLINHAQQLRAEGGAVTLHTAASLRAADEAGAGVIAGQMSTSGALSAPMAPAAVSAPALPEIPPMPLPATIPGEAQAIAMHTGPGAAGLREFADHWQSQAAVLDDVATATSQTSFSIDAHWSDGKQRAGANTAAHSTWWFDMAGRARVLASVANEVADHYDRAVAATPTPQEFADAHNRLAQANAANVASRGMLSGQVSAAAAQLAGMQSQATEAAGAYYTASASTTGSIAGTPAPAPPIATGSSSAPSATQSGKATAGKNTAAAGSAQPTSNAGAAAAGTNAVAAAGTGTSTDSLDEMAMGMLPAAAMLPMIPMSALSGLAGLSRSNAPTTATHLAGRPGVGAPDPGPSGDLGDTLPAASGGGGAEAVGAAAVPPVSSPSSPRPTAVSGPAAIVGAAAEEAATAPAGAAGGGAMATYPPMMGSSGAGAPGDQRNMRLYPDRRVVWRPAPNTEAVFGELQRERRSRVKPAAPEEGTDKRAAPEEGTDEG